MSKIKNFFSAVFLSVKIKSPISFIVCVLGFAAAFLPMLISLQLESFTNRVQVLFHKPNTLQEVLLSFAMLAVYYIVQTIFSLAQNYYVKEDSARIKRYLKEQILHLLCSVPYKYIENHEDFQEKVDFVKNYAGEKTAGSISLIFSWIASIISFLSISFILSEVSIWIVVVLIVTCVPAVVLSFLQKDETYRDRTKWMKEGRLTIHYSDSCRTMDSMKELRFFGLYPYIKNKWRGLNKIYIAKKNKVIRKHVLYNSIADLLRNGVYLIIIMLTAWKIYSNPVEGLGTFMLVITAASQLQSITTSLLICAISIFSDVKYMEDFFGLLKTEKELLDDTQAGFDDTVIEFIDVSFTYPQAEHKALEGLNVKIQQGEKIAVVGTNGSGKSTFVNLICGLYEPDSGSIKMNGVEIIKQLSSVRRSLSVVFQSFCKYQDTLRNNITISDPDRADQDSEILELTNSTGVYEIINSQENKLDEMIGIFSEQGNNLSGGQWQKVAVTRALFRKNARIYILDEPTAALDPISEANIYRNFTELTGDKTTILISHRLGITSVVDRILVFDKGKIVEDGSHAELMKQNGTYARMYRAQAKWYVLS